jgi:hypothetical protein
VELADQVIAAARIAKAMPVMIIVSIRALPAWGGL